MKRITYSFEELDTQAQARVLLAYGTELDRAIKAIGVPNDAEAVETYFYNIRFTSEGEQIV